MIFSVSLFMMGLFITEIKGDACEKLKILINNKTTKQPLIINFILL